MTISCGYAYIFLICKGITIIELIQMEPPHNEFSPNRVLMKIARGEAPRLRNSSDYSFPMNKFVEICLQKNPLDRPTCAELIENQWIVSVESNKPLRQLLAETRAEVLEEVIKVKSFPLKPILYTVYSIRYTYKI